MRQNGQCLGLWFFVLSLLLLMGYLRHLHGKTTHPAMLDNGKDSKLFEIF